MVEEIPLRVFGCRVAVEEDDGGRRTHISALGRLFCVRIAGLFYRVSLVLSPPLLVLLRPRRPSQRMAKAMCR